MVLNNQLLPGTAPAVPQHIPAPFPCLSNQNMQLRGSWRGKTPTQCKNRHCSCSVLSNTGFVQLWKGLVTPNSQPFQHKFSCLQAAVSNLSSLYNRGRIQEGLLTFKHRCHHSSSFSCLLKNTESQLQSHCKLRKQDSIKVLHFYNA